MSRVVLDHLTKTFAGPKGQTIRALQDLSLTIEEKELLVLVGPSGCGKTTALRLIAGLEEPSSGAIYIDGQAMKDVAPGDRNIAMVFQNPALYPHMTVRENIAFGLRVRKFATTEVDRRVQEAAEMLELMDCLNRRPMEISGGQCQRVAIGRALVRKPKVILLDEPFSNLDARMRSQLRLELARLHSRLSATILYVTHDQVEALTLGHRVAVLREGQLQQVSLPMEVYERPGTIFVAEFIGSQPMNLFPGTVVTRENGLGFQLKAEEAGKGPVLQLGKGLFWGLSNYSGKEVIMGIRPEHVFLLDPEETRAEAEPLPGANFIRLGTASLDLTERTGPDTYFHLRRGVQRIVSRVGRVMRATAGQTFSVALDMSHTLFFDAATERVIACGS